MTTMLTASATCALLLGAAGSALLGTAGSAAAAAAADPVPTGPSVTVHGVSRVMQYRLLERLETGGQVDEGTVRVTYTCHPGDTGLPTVSVVVVAGVFMGSTFGEEIPCDGERHTVRPAVSRRTDAPYDPPRRSVDTDVFLGFTTGPAGEEVSGGVVEPIRIRFVGF